MEMQTVLAIAIWLHLGLSVAWRFSETDGCMSGRVDPAHFPNLQIKTRRFRRVFICCGASYSRVSNRSATDMSVRPFSKILSR